MAGAHRVLRDQSIALLMIDVCDETVNEGIHRQAVKTLLTNSHISLEK